MEEKKMKNPSPLSFLFRKPENSMSLKQVDKTLRLFFQQNKTKQKKTHFSLFILLQQKVFHKPFLIVSIP